ncbi:dipeptide/oligopeptide/nickel ABC transporter permease/ATP-binding protein [Microbacterium sp. X-17]|uniref:dipeptide/oligopeptide/nickel ABC transporter permease/ATP-binding protein n=1 Tax=Microbacterium sp. X-17 TaxID=3144404 RepID=UPI0031F57DB0
MLSDPVIVANAAVLALIVVVCVAAPLITSASPIRSSTGDILIPPSAAHPLGGDGVGRDVLARLLYGGQASLLGALITVAVAIAIGAPLGLIAGYFRGWFDGVSNWVFNLIMAIPAIVLLLVVLVAVGNNIYIAMVVFGVLIAPSVFRIVRASVTAVREELYVDAARVAGLSEGRIVRRHILRVSIAPLIIQASQLLGVGVVIQAGLEFLGLGSASKPSWGGMLNDAFPNIYADPLLLVWPSAAIVITVICTSLLGNAVRDRYQGRGRQSVRPSRAGDIEVTNGGSAMPPIEGAILEVEDLRVSYGDRNVVAGVGFAVMAGEVLGIVGETGSGKSQTAFAIMGLLPAAARRRAARILFDGSDLQTIDDAAVNRLRGKRIGYIPQEPMSNLDPAFTIGSQLVEPIRRHLHISRTEARRRSLELLARVGIREPERVFRSYPHELSGGMAQRVLIAGAVSCDPDLVIADEPTTALDVTVQAEVLQLLRSLQAERGMAMMIVTHDFGVVADICDRVVVMRDGTIVESAPVRQLFADPQHAYTRLLLDSSLADSPFREELAG